MALLCHYALMDLNETWNTCWPWGEDVQDTFFDSGGKCVAMVTAYYGKTLWKIILILILRWRCARQFLTVVESVFALVIGILWHNIWGKLCPNYLTYCKAILWGGGIHHLQSYRNSAIPQPCTFGGDVYYALHNLLIHLLQNK